MQVRRVVTGHSPAGKAIVASDRRIDAAQAALFPGFSVNTLWASDAEASVPAFESSRDRTTLFPAAGGVRCIHIAGGSVDLRVEDGQVVVSLTAGDTVVQSGTWHRWENRTTEPCHIVYWPPNAPRKNEGRADVNRASPGRQVRRCHWRRVDRRSRR